MQWASDATTAGANASVECREPLRPLAVIALALLLRLHAAVGFPATPAADAQDYDGLARRLARGAGYVADTGEPTAWRPPGYPAFLASTYFVLGTQARRAYVVQAFLGTLTVALIMLLGHRILGRAQGLTAGLLAATYPGFVWLSRVLLSENLAIPLLLGALLVTTRLIASPSLLRATGLGLLLGAATLTRPGTLFLVPVLFAGVLVSLSRRQSRRVAGLYSVIPLVVILGVVFPWAYRNASVFNRGLLIATQDGLTLYASYWPPRHGSKRIWGNLPGAEDPVVAEALSLRNEADVAAFLRQVTINRLARQPLWAISLWPEKALALLAPFDWEWFPRPAGESRTLNIGYIAVLPFSIWGLSQALRRRQPPHWILWALPVSVSAQSLLFYGSPRFRVLAEPTLLLLAAAAFVGCRSHRPGCPSRQSGDVEVRFERGTSAEKRTGRAKIRLPLMRPGAAVTGHAGLPAVGDARGDRGA